MAGPGCSGRSTRIVGSVLRGSGDPATVANALNGSPRRAKCRNLLHSPRLRRSSPVLGASAEAGEPGSLHPGAGTAALSGRAPPGPGPARGLTRRAFRRYRTVLTARPENHSRAAGHRGRHRRRSRSLHRPTNQLRRPSHPGRRNRADNPRRNEGGFCADLEHVPGLARRQPGLGGADTGRPHPRTSPGEPAPLLDLATLNVRVYEYRTSSNSAW